MVPAVGHELDCERETEHDGPRIKIRLRKRRLNMLLFSPPERCSYSFATPTARPGVVVGIAEVGERAVVAAVRVGAATHTPDRRLPAAGPAETFEPIELPVIDTANFAGDVLWSVWLIEHRRLDPASRATSRRLACSCRRSRDDLTPETGEPSERRAEVDECSYCVVTGSRGSRGDVDLRHDRRLGKVVAGLVFEIECQSLSEIGARFIHRRSLTGDLDFEASSDVPVTFARDRSRQTHASRTPAQGDRQRP